MSEWIKNTAENPFFKQREPCALKYRDGTIVIAKCPGCYKPSFQYVGEWRLATEEEVAVADKEKLGWSRAKKWFKERGL